MYVGRDSATNGNTIANTRICAIIACTDPENTSTCGTVYVFSIYFYDCILFKLFVV